MRTDRTAATYAAVVLYFRLGSEVEATLRALHTQTLPASTTLLVDNASGDGIASTAAQGFPDVTLLPLTTNQGYAAGMNAGAAQVTDEPTYLLFLTHEAQLPPDGAARLIAEAEATGAAIVGPTLVDADGTVFSRGGTFNRRGTATHIHEAGSPPAVAWIDGAALLVRRSVFEALGGFDQSFFLYWEDVDFSERAAHLGPLHVSAEVRVEQSQRGMPPYLNARGRVRFWRQRGRTLKVAMAPIAIIARALYAWLYCAATGRPRPRPALMDVIRGSVDGLSGRLRMEGFQP